MIWERISQQDEQHVRELAGLKNPHLASIWNVEFLDSHYWIVSILMQTYHQLRYHPHNHHCNVL